MKYVTQVQWHIDTVKSLSQHCQISLSTLNMDVCIHCWWLGVVNNYNEWITWYSNNGKYTDAHLQLFQFICSHYVYKFMYNEALKCIDPRWTLKKVCRPSWGTITGSLNKNVTTFTFTVPTEHSHFAYKVQDSIQHYHSQLQHSNYASIDNDHTHYTFMTHHSCNFYISTYNF